MHLNFNRDLSAPFTNEEIETLGLEQVAGVGLFAFDLRDVALPGPMTGMVVAPELNPKLLKLVQAAPHMYTTLGRQFRMLQQIIDYLETVAHTTEKQTGQRLQFAHDLAATMTQMQDMCLLGQRIAIVGPEQVNKEVQTESRRSP